MVSYQLQLIEKKNNSGLLPGNKHSHTEDALFKLMTRNYTSYKAIKKCFLFELSKANAKTIYYQN